MRYKAVLFLLLMLLMMALACQIPGSGSGSVTPTVTPTGDTLSFSVPFAYNLEPGETVPGTRLQYIGSNPNGYDVSIDGLTAVKHGGDSFIWSGVLAPGVYATYNLRITTAIFSGLPVAGIVELVVFNPEPFAMTPTAANQTTDLHYSNVVVNYQVPVGAGIPGTSLKYEGMSEQGSGGQTTKLAVLSGLTGYPYLATGDSLTWTGQLRSNVFVTQNMRVLSISDTALFVGGTAEVWIQP